MMREWLLAGCLLLTGCAATSQEPAALRPDAVHPRVVELSFANGLAAVSYYYGADGVTAWQESHEPENLHDATTPQVIKRTTRTPSVQQWERFWRALDRMHVERWRSVYLSSDDPDGMTLTDATYWRLMVATPPRTFRSGGDAYPYNGRPKRTIALIGSAGADRPSKYSLPQDNMIAQLEQAFDHLLQEPPNQ